MSAVGFLGLPESLTGADAPAVVVPVPLEKTVTYQRGTRNGPSAIIKASHQVEFYDEVLRTQAARCGIRTLPAVDCRPGLNPTIDTVRELARDLFEAGRFPVFLGGEHSISIGVLQALKDVHGPVTVLQVDAHADLRESYHGSPNNHACVMARAREAGHRLVQVGIRALSGREARRIDEDDAITCFYDHDRRWREAGAASIAEALGSGPVYVTIDVDGLDPAIMPATGTPVPGGLDWAEVTALLEAAFDRNDVVGADLNELRPLKEFKGCDMLAARLVYRMIGLKARSAGWTPLIDDELSEED